MLLLYKLTIFKLRSTTEQMLALVSTGISKTVPTFLLQELIFRKIKRVSP
jgi:hypothetical protein